MPECCKNCTGRDANNNTCVGGAYGGGNSNHTSSSACNSGGNGNGGSSSQCNAARHIQVTAKVMFGSVQAISHMKMAEKAARENKRT
ncbi:uncharacterized protein LOC123294463 [Chrysoperla carnea]|uniref:uncharacterized protein LOC123294463 n=1 Tax=Chrysoperla carnea TaxID=189513 RepID=UPI001D08D3CE|nr:uncharacterized protein LOC123294463 [Chrysoperla carnea]